MNHESAVLAYAVFLSDIRLHQSSAEVGFVVLVVVVRLGGKRLVRAAVQEAVDQRNDEHLHDHHLLTEHWGAERCRDVSQFQRWMKKDTLCGCFLQDPRAWEEKGGAQAMVAFRERMLMIDVCSWLKTRISWGEKKQLLVFRGAQHRFALSYCLCV